MFKGLFEEKEKKKLQQQEQNKKDGSPRVVTDNPVEETISSKKRRKTNNEKTQNDHQHHQIRPPQEQRTDDGRNSTRNFQKNNDKRQDFRDKRSRDSNNRKEGATRNFPEKQPISQEALDFSQQLQGLSRQKRTAEALELFHSFPNPDKHHACIVIDCCSRSGDMINAERIATASHTYSGSNDFSSSRYRPSVEIQTALLKGYVHSGNMIKATELWKTISVPNVRTLNTFLRGCLWSATDSSGVGGVASSEMAWERFCQLKNTDDKVDKKSRFVSHDPDVSSYEYTITILCQALRVEEATKRIEQFQSLHSIRTKGKATLVTDIPKPEQPVAKKGKGKRKGSKNVPEVPNKQLQLQREQQLQGILETLTVVYLSLARAHALRGEADAMWRACQLSLSAVQRSRALLLAQQTENEPISDNKKHKIQPRDVSGGKRGWRKADNQVNTDRSVSNTAFRTHKLSELELDVRELLKCRKCLPSRKLVVDAMKHQLLYFSGGGTTTNIDVEEDKTDVNRSCAAATFHSFGLSEINNEREDGNTDVSMQINDVLSFDSYPVHPTGKILMDRVFENNSLPLHIEIGSGFGSWIVDQATANSGNNYAAVELRADRVAQIFSRYALRRSSTSTSDSPTQFKQNLCVIGAECGALLRRYVKKDSVTAFYANYPEPPTQAYGALQTNLNDVMDGKNELSHMLQRSTVVNLAGCLKVNGRIHIVTDNRSYARLLGATFVSVIKEQNKKKKGPRLRSLGPNSLEGKPHLTETFSNQIHIYECYPGSSSSYFDRLWQSGAGGRHVAKRSRFMLVLERCTK